MEKIKVEKAVNWTKSKLVAGNAGDYIYSISTDTRSLGKGDFFIPLRGVNFNGHDFLKEAVKKGASGFVYEKKNGSKIKEFLKNRNILIIEAIDSLKFLEDLAYHYIRMINPVAIGITGSVGKTTTKDLLISVLKKGGNVQFTPKNYNNEVGVSKSVLNIGYETEYFVAELAMRGKNQVSLLSEIINTDIGIITNVSESHLEFLGTVEEIALAKSEIAAKIEENSGVLFLNRDDRWSDFIYKNIKCNVIWFGRNNNLDFNFIDMGFDKNCRYIFDFYKNDKKLAKIKLGIPGYNNIYNGCVTAAVATHLKVNIDIIKEGIENPEISEKRLDIFSKNGKTVINDCYNASPASMMQAIDILVNIYREKGNRTVAILGDMLELGENSCNYHYNMGTYLRKKKVDLLLSFGKLSENTYMGFVEGGTREDNAFYFKDKLALMRKVSKILKKGDIILVKGSRANKMEDIIRKI
ncbi:MAG: UDP-N-acetylmuramoyl-tripeptide--D-alanyl-D-alanine ligase [Candidatus Humimicrobiaceae bacterium]